MTTNFSEDEVFLTTDQVLEYLHLNIRTIYRLIKAGKIPAVRIGRQWRFRKADIDIWLENARRRDSKTVPAAAPKRTRRQRVLVVDDEPNIREVLTKTLAIDEYDVDAVGDGPTALDRMRASTYDLLITDLKMPGMDGLSLIEQAKRLKSDLPVIIITGFSSESAAIDAVNLGVAGYLIKPIRVPAVLAAAAKALGRHAA